MEIPETTKARLQYSTVNKTQVTTVLYSKAQASQIFNNLTDVIPNQDYHPWFRRKLNVFGLEAFMDYVAKARAGSDTPHVLFRWMLTNPEEVK